MKHIGSETSDRKHKDEERLCSLPLPRGLNSLMYDCEKSCMQAFLPWPAATDCGYEQTRYPDGPQKEPRVQTVAVNAPPSPTSYPQEQTKSTTMVCECVFKCVYIYTRTYIHIYT